MRFILVFNLKIFSICAFATTTNFVSELTFSKTGSDPQSLDIKYPFSVAEKRLGAEVTVDPASDAQFFVATGVLSMMYCVFIIAVYLFIDDFYKSKAEIPLADFGLTTILAIFWLSGSAAWANGTSAFKMATEPNSLAQQCDCAVVRSSFSRLNVSLVSSFYESMFLNF